MFVRIYYYEPNKADFVVCSLVNRLAFQYTELSYVFVYVFKYVFYVAFVFEDVQFVLQVDGIPLISSLS